MQLLTSVYKSRLCGPRGIGIVQKWLSNAPYKGKGYETEDLGLLLQRLQHWAHRLYPRLPFSQAIVQIEKLGNKKALQVSERILYSYSTFIYSYYLGKLNTS